MAAHASPHPVLIQIVVGLAGHIDHGKSSLVQRLTGAATDRRPEEQRRGMTVDLGFAHFDAGEYRFALIDVPGHDRFVHNMVSGATGVHLGMLVVAADDSVMPQTREHLEILDLLDVPGGVIAVTKCDLVDAARLDSVRAEITRLVASTTFEGVPIVAVSTVEGRGLHQLREVLVARAAGVRQIVEKAEENEGPFRMPVDRVFSLPGRGTIVTGTIRRGTVRIGESLLLVPSSQRVRVRDLQRQGMSADSLFAGDRAAINLAGVKSSQVSRGDELLAENVYQPSHRLLIRLSVLARCEGGIEDREQVRLHAGTREVTARIRLPRSAARPGERLLAVLECQRPVVVEHGQRVILRRLSPPDTIGGGPVLTSRAAPGEHLKRLWEIGGQFASDDAGDRLLAWVELQGPTRAEDVVWPLEIGVSRHDVQRHLGELLSRGALIRLSREAGTVVTMARWESLLHQARHHCERQSRRQHPERWFPRAMIVQRLDRQNPPALTESAIDELIARKWLSARDTSIALAERRQLSKRQQQLLQQIVEAIAAAGAAPPLRKELAEQHQVSIKDLEPLLERLCDDGRLVRISDELAVAPEVRDRLLRSLRELLGSQPTVSVAELRDRWKVTRKHALPYLQYFDEQQCTERSESVRIAGPCLNNPRSAEHSS